MGSEGIAFLLRQADTLLKDGKYEAALKLIRAVRVQDPQNPYAKAYEDRVRALVLSTHTDGSGRGDPAPIRQAGIPSTNSGEGSTQIEPENPAAVRQLRIKNYIRLARAFLAAGRKDEALTELAFASMIDPRNEEVLTLEEEIRQGGREIIAEPDSSNIPAQDEIVPPECPPSEIAQVTETAEPSTVESMAVEEQVATPASEPIMEEQEADLIQAVEQDFTESEMMADLPTLREDVANENAAGVIDPEQLEKTIPAVNTESEQGEGEVPEQVAYAEQVGDIPAELPVSQAERTDAVPRQPDESDRQTANNEIESHRSVMVRRQLVRAMKLFLSGAFDEALSEVALGLVEDPDNAELHALEGKIWRAKDAVSGDQGENRYQRDHLVRLHLLAAEEFRKKSEFTRALDEIAKAYAIEPENKEIQQTDARIRQGETRQHRNDGKILKLVYPNTRAAGGSA